MPENLLIQGFALGARSRAVEGRYARVQFGEKPISLAARPHQAKRLAEPRPDNRHGKANDTEHPGVVRRQIKPKSKPRRVEQERREGARHAEPTRARLSKLVETCSRQSGLLSRECGDQPFYIGVHIRSTLAATTQRFGESLKFTRFSAAAQ